MSANFEDHVLSLAQHLAFFNISSAYKMDIRRFFSRKRPLEKSDDDKDEVPPPKSTDQEAEGQSTTHMKTKSVMSKAAKKLVYKSRLSYKKHWETIYLWGGSRRLLWNCY